MTLRATFRVLLNLAGVIAGLYGLPASCGQGAAKAVLKKIPLISIPFVGCPSSGQIVELEAPKGTSVAVPIGAQDAKALVYYKSADGISVLAPRGWYCLGASGSSGAGLFLGPKPIIRTSSGWEVLEGAAMDVNVISGENGGRYEIAELILRVFPLYRAFARKLWEDLDIPVPSSPFPDDRLTYRSDTAVEYKTPAQTDGLGNFHSYIGKNDLPIAGVAILTIDTEDPIRNVPHLTLLSVRFPPDLERLIPTIVNYVHDVTLSTQR